MLPVSIIEKYLTSVPRYTSYPTAPEWKTTFNAMDYHQAIHRFNPASQSMSIYVHIPFCEKRCYFCGCNVLIRTGRKAEIGDHYLDLLEHEVAIVTAGWSQHAKVTQFHIGGGTPNYLSNLQLERLYGIIRGRFEFSPDAELSIEIDPRHVTQPQIQTLAALGVNRLSMGIQDMNLKVQVAINRVQPFEMVESVFVWAREAGILAINVDLIYGLPHQSLATFDVTVDQIIGLRPSRVALYSYAHIPDLISHQRLIHDIDMPDFDEKLAIFQQSRAKMEAAGWISIGMDHFAEPMDDIAVAFRKGELHRNFMGYTVMPADGSLGFGVSAIGQLSGAYIQNTKSFSEYEASIKRGELPVDRGIWMSEDDQVRNWVIHRLMCRFSVSFEEFEVSFGRRFDDYFGVLGRALSELANDGLLRLSETSIDVTPLGQLLVRNVCAAFDVYLNRKEIRFSKSI